jgi:serine/threonine protein kinase
MINQADEKEIDRTLAILNADLAAGVSPNAILMAKLDAYYRQCSDPGLSGQIQRLKNRIRAKKYLGCDLLRDVAAPEGDAIERRLWEAAHNLKNAYDGAHSKDNALETKYDLGAFVGSGEMSEVIQAVRRSDGQTVAIKYLKPEHFHKRGYVDRFNRECAHCLQFDHPHIIRTFESGEYNGHGFIVMEYLPLGDMEKLLAHSRPGLAEALVVAGQAADALAYLHDQMKVVHRDVKLSNLLVERWTLDTNGLPAEQIHVKLTDFGLSKEMADDDLTRAGVEMGTPGYQAPEMISDAGSADHRADIYSLGVATYRMLYGDASPTKPYQPLCKSIPDIPEKVDAMLERCLKHERDDRLDSAAEFASTIKDIQGEMVAA